MNRDDFSMLKQDIVYLDNGATTLKPRILGEAILDYYNNYSANAHRGDYDISLKVDNAFEHTRTLVKAFINAKSRKEVVFTSGATDSLNKIAFGYFAHTLSSGDEVLITEAEHASNVLPWFELQDKIGVKVKYIPLDNNKVTLDNVIKSITPLTRVISIAHITNVIGDIRPIKDIVKYAHKCNIKVVVDGAQSVPHMSVDVQDLDIDFLAFSAHKMCGPTGVGVLYGKEEYLNNLYPLEVGGGMNASFDPDGSRVYDELPERLEPGTPNIAGVIGFGATLEYLNNIGMDKIRKYEEDLRKYAINELKGINDIIIYNEASEAGIIAINMKDIFAQDLAIYLNKYHICVRAGNHCAKMVKHIINIKNTVRISLYFYNTKEDIDSLVKALKNPNMKEEII